MSSDEGGNWDLFGPDFVFDGSQVEDEPEPAAGAQRQAQDEELAVSSEVSVGVAFAAERTENIVVNRKTTTKKSKKEKEKVELSSSKRLAPAVAVAVAKNARKTKPKLNRKDAWKLQEPVLIAWYSGGFHRIAIPDGRGKETFGKKFLSPSWVASNIVDAPLLQDMPEGRLDDALQALAAIKRALAMKRKYAKRNPAGTKTTTKTNSKTNKKTRNRNGEEE